MLCVSLTEYVSPLALNIIKTDPSTFYLQGIVKFSLAAQPVQSVLPKGVSQVAAES